MGEVTKIHHIRYSFDSVELWINLDDRRILHKSLVLKEGNYNFNVWSQEVKNRNCEPFEELELESSEDIDIIPSDE